MEILSSNKTRHFFANRQMPGTGWITEAFWDLGIERKLVRQFETLRLLRRFDVMRKNFYTEFWAGIAEQTGASLSRNNCNFQLTCNQHSLIAQGTRIIHASNLTHGPDDVRMAPSFNWRQGHPIYSPESRSVVHLLFLSGEMLTATRSTRPAIRGDGKSSIYKLIRKENLRRLASKGWLGLQPLLVDANAQIFLLINNRSFDDIPALGQKITVKFGVEETSRFSNTTVSGEIMADVRTACESLVNQSPTGFLSVTLACDNEYGPVRRDDCSLINVSEQPDLAPYLFTSLPQDSERTLEALMKAWQGTD